MEPLLYLLKLYISQDVKSIIEQDMIMSPTDDNTMDDLKRENKVGKQNAHKEKVTQIESKLPQELLSFVVQAKDKRQGC